MKRLVVLLLTVLTPAVISLPAWGQPLTRPELACQKTIGKGGAKFKKTKLKLWSRCLDALNDGQTVDCSPPTIDLKASITAEKVVAAVGRKCDGVNLANLGFTGTCAFEPAPAGVEALCAALPATTKEETARCVLCWKEAEINEFVAILYASRALQVCDGDLGETSSSCSDLDCPSPIPAQGAPGDPAGLRCQRAIQKAGIKFFLTREKILERCLDNVAAKGVGACPNPDTDARIAAAASKKDAAIRRGCDADGDGDLPPGFVWWQCCPENSTGQCCNLAEDPIGTSVSNLITCVDRAAEEIVDELICLQKPRFAPCPTESSTTTTTTSTTTTTTASSVCGDITSGMCGSGGCPLGQSCLYNGGGCACFDSADFDCRYCALVVGGCPNVGETCDAQSCTCS